MYVSSDDWIANGAYTLYSVYFNLILFRFLYRIPYTKFNTQII